MLSTYCTDLLFVLTAVNWWCRVLCREEFKMPLLINTLTGVPIRTAVVTAHRVWQLLDTFLLQSIYCCNTLLCWVTVRIIKLSSEWNRLYSNNTLIGTYCITGNILQSVHQTAPKKCNCFQGTPSGSSVVFYCVLVTVSSFISVPQMCLAQSLLKYNEMIDIWVIHVAYVI